MICPIEAEDFAAVLEVYRQCEDFLSLGPQAEASPDMVSTDIQHSKESGGIYCGIFLLDAPEKPMVGIVDFSLSGNNGYSDQTFLSLLMIARPYRSRGIGSEVVRLVEAEIKKNPEINKIISGVQVNNPEGIRFWNLMGYQINSGAEPQADGTIAYDLLKKI